MPGNRTMGALQKVQSALMTKSLSTMVKGIRAAKDRGQSEYIAKCMQEIKKELLHSDYNDKSNALKKLIYLQMIGYDMNWAAFRVIEVMGSNWYGNRRIGYLAAALSFTPDTDVMILTTHIFRKAFTGGPSAGQAGGSEGFMYETGSALSCLANIVTPDLGRDLLNDVYTMMNSSRPYIRKKAVLVLFRICIRWPQALRLSFARLKEKLDDDHQGVVSAAVYVICELAERNSRNYLPLAPQFFKILTASNNNWVLIKVVKLLGSLVPLEPRLAKKLAEPLTTLITTTPAKSLLYECVNTLLKGKLTSKSVIRLCLEKLRSFIEDPDQNLKYLGLLGLHKLMQKHPSVVSEHKELVLNCLNDDDVTIRQRALDLITSMVSKKNLMGIIRRLVQHLDTAEGDYRNTVLKRIVDICSQDNYAYISDFAWYVSTLVDLTNTTQISEENAIRISSQLQDVIIRVPAVRAYGVAAMIDVLLSGRLVAPMASSSVAEVLHAAAWLCGEFSQYLTDHLDLLTALLKPNIAALSVNVQVVVIQNVLKILAATLSIPFSLNQVDAKSSDSSDSDEDGDEKKVLSYQKWESTAKEAVMIVLNGLPLFTSSNFVEVQERAVSYYNLVQWLADPLEGPGLFLSSKVNQPTEQPVEDTPTAEQPVEDLPTPDEPVDLLGLDPVEEPAPAVEEKAVDLFDPLATAATFDALATTDTPVEPTEAPPATDVEPEVKEAAEFPDMGFEAAPISAAEEKVTAPSGLEGLSAEELSERVSRTRDLVLQLRVLFSEALNPVHPEAQARVPIPSGLDLDTPINDDESEPSERSGDEFTSDEEKSPAVSEPDSEDSPATRKRKKKAAKARAKEKERRAKKKRQKDIFDDDEYEIKKATPEEIEAARARREAIEAQRAHDPYYIGAMSAKTSNSITEDDVNQIPVASLDDAGLPPLEVEGEKKSKKKKSRTKAIAKVARSEYVVAAIEDLPEGVSLDDAPKKRADSADEADDMDIDLSAPLGADEVIPQQLSYAELQKQKAREKKNAPADETGGKKKKKDKKNKKGKKKKRSKETEEQGEGDEADAEAGEEAEAVADAVEAEEAATPVVDLFDPLATPPSAEAESEQALPISNGTPRVLFEDSSLSLAYSVTPTEMKTAAAHLRFEIKYTGKREGTVTLQVSSGDSYTLDTVTEGKAGARGASLTFPPLNRGDDASNSCVIRWNSEFAPSTCKAKLTIVNSKKTKAEKLRFSIGIADFLVAHDISVEGLGAVACPANSRRLLTIREDIQIPQALKLIASDMHVKLIQAVNCMATYFGRLSFDSSPVVIMVKAKKGDNEHLAVSVKCASEENSDAVLDAVQDLLCPVEEEEAEADE